MENSTQLNIIRYLPPTSDSTQNERTLTQEQKQDTQLNNNEASKVDNTISTVQHQSDVYKATIYGSVPAQAPGGRYTLKEREERIDAYATRVNLQKKNIESGSEGERNVKFQNVRLFMDPSGYFSGGLLAAGFDPHEKFTVTFDTYVGMGTATNLSDTGTRTYSAWEIAAGVLDHDTPARGGIVNFHGMVIDPKDRSKINDLQSFGKQLQKHWERDIATPMRGSAKTNTFIEVMQALPFVPHIPYTPTISTVIPERSGKADAYVARGALQSLRSDKEAFEKLSSSGQKAISRTLDKNGQVIIPNIYGYPLSGYAFIPYRPYDGNDNNRPNQGVMFDLRSGAVREIKGDDDFATWAKDNRNQLISRFNASDLQGGQDAHWPPAATVLDSLIRDNTSHYLGRDSLVTDKSVPVRELFNYTQSRGGDYELKFGNLNKGIASHYREVNAKNALWDDQTKVFGAVEQDWKAAREVWGNTFGYVPVLGNAGNIVFGKHDADHGMTASDRVGGRTGEVISGLLLAHEVIPAGVEAGLGEPPLNFNTTGSQHYGWRYNEQTKHFDFAKKLNASNDSDITSVANTASNEPGTPHASETEGAHPTIEPPNSKGAFLNSIENLPTGEALFSTPEKNVILSGELNELNTVNEKLCTFTDFNKKGTQERLNILVHGSVDPDTGIAKVSYNGKLNTPQELLQTLHNEGIYPETFDNVRLLSCDSASGGDASFAAEFQKLIGRPVKGYSGTLTANLAPENVNAAVVKVENVYLEALQKNQNTPLTGADRALARSEAEKYVAKELAQKTNFRAAKKNPYWNPLKWWAFTYKPETFPKP
ncbi:MULTISPECIES: hypothetical protein [Pseudomonas fluorescens group]|uniref:Peptidase C80 domain-containing protein n=1 Tax=Pseudomonas fluorescens TaxID=294 RepID=A0A0D0TMS8_PSEFL|nr:MULTISPECIES: hypothetical protein [Pseudomonas fluorescens group]AZE59283.1 hypothetical protein C4K02_0905 [Pseudomonas synxantha]KIR22240.1 hypothetical protein PFLU3_22940 [Pseudomonas fluorescens]